MIFESTSLQYIITGVIAAIIGGIFGASGLLFFPLKRFMEGKLQKAEKDAFERIQYQKDMFTIRAEEKSSMSRYLFWLKEIVIYLINESPSADDVKVYWREHLNECADDLSSIQKRRKELEREHLARYHIDNL